MSGASRTHEATQEGSASIRAADTFQRFAACGCDERCEKGGIPCAALFGFRGQLQTFSLEGQPGLYRVQSLGEPYARRASRISGKVPYEKVLTVIGQSTENPRDA